MSLGNGANPEGRMFMDSEKFQELILHQFEQLNTRLEKLETKIDKIDASQIRTENELIDKIRGLYDFREVQNDVNERIINTLGSIETKIDVLQIETANIRRVK